MKLPSFFRSHPVSDETAMLPGFPVIRAIVAGHIVSRNIAGYVKKVPGHAGQQLHGLLVPKSECRVVKGFFSRRRGADDIGAHEVRVALLCG